MDSSARTLSGNKTELSAEGASPSRILRKTAPSPNFNAGSKNDRGGTTVYVQPITKQQKNRRLPLSKLKERAGLKIKAQYALIRCICKEKLIAKKDQQTRLCPFCGRRIWLADRRVLFQSNNLDLLKKLMCFRPDNGQCMGYYHPSFMLLSRFSRSNLSSTGAKRKTVSHSCANSPDGAVC